MTCIILNYTWFETVEKLFVLQIDREKETKQAFSHEKKWTVITDMIYVVLKYFWNLMNSKHMIFPLDMFDVILWMEMSIWQIMNKLKRIIFMKYKSYKTLLISVLFQVSKRISLVGEFNHWTRLPYQTPEG